MYPFAINHPTSEHCLQGMIRTNLYTGICKSVGTKQYISIYHEEQISCYAYINNCEMSICVE